MKTPCPYCGKRLKRLDRHILLKHPDIVPEKKKKPGQKAKSLSQRNRDNKTPDTGTIMDFQVKPQEGKKKMGEDRDKEEPSPGQSSREDYRCGNCGTIINKTHKYCPGCGEELLWHRI